MFCMCPYIYTAQSATNDSVKNEGKVIQNTYTIKPKMTNQGARPKCRPCARHKQSLELTSSKEAVKLS